MVKKFFRKANSLLLVAAMTVTLMPAQAASAAGTDAAADSAVLQQADVRAGDTALDVAAITAKEYTVIEGNAPALPKKANVQAVDGTVAPADIQWTWDTSVKAGKHTATGTAGGTQITVNVNVLPCDEVVEEAQAKGRKEGDTAQDKLDAIHQLKGYKGKFVTEYDIVPNNEYPTTDRAVIYLPAADKDGAPFSSESCWDYGARLQFKFEHNGTRYFQTQVGDGQDKDSAKYYPMPDNDLREALNNGQTVDRLLVFDEVSTYRVRTEMDTTTDTTKGNVKIFITDPDGIEHEVTQPGGNGFRIYPTDGIVKSFAAMRGGYRLINHKVSWIEGYATKKVETYLKANTAKDYVKEAEDVVTKHLPGSDLTETPKTEIVKDGKTYNLDTDKSGWYNGDTKVDSVTAAEGQTAIYRAYYNEPEVKVESVNPAKKDYFVVEGKTLDLKKVFTVAPENATNQSLTYSVDSKSKNYASITSGVLTVKKNGVGKKVVVTATATDGSEVSDTITVTIDKVAVKKIAFNKAPKSVKIGKSVTLNVKFTPAKPTNTNVTWSLDKASKRIATLKSGKLTVKKTAKKGQKIKVTVTSKDNRKVKKTITIKVAK